MASMSKPLRTALLILLVSAGILNQADRQIIALLKPMIEVDLHWSDADYGTLAAVFQLSAALAFPFAGWFVDRLQPKFANTIAVGLWSIAAGLHGFTTSFLQFLSARVFLGASEALGTPITVKTLSVLFENARERSFYFGLVGGVSCIGAIIIPISIPLIAVYFGWRMTFIVAGIVGLLWALGWYLTARRANWRWHGTALNQSASWSEVLHDRRTWIISAAKVLSDQAWWLLLFWIPDYLHRTYHLGVMAMALPVAMVYSLSSGGSLLGGWLPAHMAKHGKDIFLCRKPVMMVAGLAVSVVLFISQVPNYWLAALLFGLTLAAHQVFSANLFGVITDIMPETRVGRVTGVSAFCGNLAGMGIVQATGLRLNAGGGYFEIFLFTALAYAAAPFVLRLLSSPVAALVPRRGTEHPLASVALHSPGE